MKALYIILERIAEAEYGYGGWTGREEERVEVLGFVESEEEARAKVKELSQGSEKRAKKLGYRWVEYEYELIFRL